MTLGQRMSSQQEHSVADMSHPSNWLGSVHLVYLSKQGSSIITRDTSARIFARSGRGKKLDTGMKRTGDSSRVDTPLASCASAVDIGYGTRIGIWAKSRSRAESHRRVAGSLSRASIARDDLRRGRGVGVDTVEGDSPLLGRVGIAGERGGDGGGWEVCGR
jgi:hypothetical protein